MRMLQILIVFTLLCAQITDASNSTSLQGAKTVLDRNGSDRQRNQTSNQAHRITATYWKDIVRNNLPSFQIVVTLYVDERDESPKDFKSANSTSDNNATVSKHLPSRDVLMLESKNSPTYVTHILQNNRMTTNDNRDDSLENNTTALIHLKLPVCGRRPQVIPKGTKDPIWLTTTTVQHVRMNQNKFSDNITYTTLAHLKPGVYGRSSLMIPSSGTSDSALATKTWNVISNTVLAMFEWLWIGIEEPRGVNTDLFNRRTVTMTQDFTGAVDSYGIFKFPEKPAIRHAESLTNCGFALLILTENNYYSSSENLYEVSSENTTEVSNVANLPHLIAPQNCDTDMIVIKNDGTRQNLAHGVLPTPTMSSWRELVFSDNKTSAMTVWLSPKETQKETFNLVGRVNIAPNRTNSRQNVTIGKQTVNHRDDIMRRNPPRVTITYTLIFQHARMIQNWETDFSTNNSETWQNATQAWTIIRTKSTQLIRNAAMAVYEWMWPKEIRHEAYDFIGRINTAPDRNNSCQNVTIMKKTATHRDDIMRRNPPRVTMTSTFQHAMLIQNCGTDHYIKNKPWHNATILASNPSTWNTSMAVFEWLWPKEIRDEVYQEVYNFIESYLSYYENVFWNWTWQDTFDVMSGWWLTHYFSYAIFLFIQYVRGYLKHLRQAQLDEIEREREEGRRASEPVQPQQPKPRRRTRRRRR